MGFLQSYGGYRGGDGEALSRSAGDAAMAGFRTLDDVTVAGKTVLVRVALNVPMKDGRITDDLPISRILPTLHELSPKGPRGVVRSHFGPPDGQPVPGLSVKAGAAAPAYALGAALPFADDGRGSVAK